MQNLTQLPFYVSSMTIDKVHWFLDLFDELGIKVWIDGGWGVDALLGECTREHRAGSPVSIGGLSGAFAFWIYIARYRLC